MALNLLSQFPGTSSPASGFITSAGGGINANNGKGTPASYAAHCGVSWGSSFPKNQQLKVGLLAGLENGAEIRLYWRLQGDGTAALTADCYFLKIFPGSILSVPDNPSDKIEIWKRVASVETQIGPTVSLRHYRILNGHTFTAVMMEDEILVKYGNGDHITDDFIVMHESDSSLSAGGFTGILSMSGSHTTEFENFKAGSVEAKWTSLKTGASDANAGTPADPFATIGKLTRSLVAGEYGIVEGDESGGGIYSEHIAYYAGALPASGTSWENAITMLRKKGHTFYHTHGTTGGGCHHIKGDFKYRVYCDFKFHRVSGNGTYGLFIWSDTTNGVRPHHIRVQGGEISGWKASGILTSVATQADANAYYSYHHLLDIHNHHNGSSFFDHGFYFSTAGNVFEYLNVHHNAGCGGQVINSSGFLKCNDNVMRYSDCYENNQKNSDGTGPGLSGSGMSGWLFGSGTGQQAYGNRCWKNSNGITAWSKASSCVIFNNICWLNTKAGIAIEANFGNINTGNKVLNNASVKNLYGYTVEGQGINSEFRNNIAHLNTSVNFTFLGSGNSGTVFSKNMESADVGGPFGEFFGDPGFISLIEGLEDFHLSGELDGGENLSAYLTMDMEGRPQPQRVTFGLGPIVYPSPNNNSPLVIMPLAKSITSETNTSMSEIGVEDVDNNIVEILIKARDGATFVMTPQAGVTILGAS